MSILVREVTKVFDGRGIAGLHGISLELGPGETVALVGPNGSGKTTLLKVMSRQILPDTGSVSGNAVLFSGLPPARDQKVQDFLTESCPLPVEFEKKIQLARDLADIFEVTFQLRQLLSELSAGQLQKVLLAAALIGMPRTLLLDEPFAQLDPFTRTDILASLFQYTRAREISVFMVTHDLEEALRYSDRLGVMNFGKLLDLRRPEQVLTKPRESFVARFLGYKNFIPVQRSARNWDTPWGEQKFDSPLDLSEALLVIPDQAWRIDAASPLSFRVDSEALTSLGWLLKLTARERSYFWRINHRQKEQLPKSVRLSPVWEDCFLLPL